MKLCDVLYLVADSQDVARLEKLARELPVEIEHPWLNVPYVRDALLDVVLQVDVCEDYDMIVNLDRCTDRICMGAGPLRRFYRDYDKETEFGEMRMSAKLDYKLLEKIIKPTQKEARIECESPGYVITYQQDGKEQKVLIKFWDGVL